MHAKPRPQSFWRRVVDESDRDGVGVVAKRHGLKPRTLTWWRWRLSHAPAPSKAAAPRLLPVALIPTGTPQRDALVEIVVDEIRIRCAVGTDVDFVARLVAGLRTPCSR
jgi:hypothetical protein